MERPELSQLESLLTSGIKKKHISITYDLLMANNDAHTVLVKEKWENDLGIQIENDQWSLLLIDAQQGLISARYKICNFNVLHRIHYTPEKISRFKGDASPYCTRCESEVGNLLHMLWGCPKLSRWWDAIENSLKKVLDMDLTLSPSIVLLGDYSDLRLNSVHSAGFLRLDLTAAKKCILSGLLRNPPTILIG